MSNTACTKLASESKDMDRALASLAPVQGTRFVVFSSARQAVDYAQDVATARALAKLHKGYAKDESGRIYARAI